MGWCSRVLACALACTGSLLMTTTAQAALARDAANPSSSATVNVAVLDTGFDPASLSIPVGTVVLWTNRGTRAHTVTAVDGSFASDDLAPGATFSYQPVQVGTLQYRDIHSNATGVLTVVPGSLQGAGVPTTSGSAPPGTQSQGAQTPGSESPAGATGNRAGGPTMAFTGTSDWILAAVAGVLLLAGVALIRKRPAAGPFRVDVHTALAIERARRRRDDFLPRRRPLLKR